MKLICAGLLLLHLLSSVRNPGTTQIAPLASYHHNIRHSMIQNVYQTQYDTECAASQLLLGKLKPQ